MSGRREQSVTRALCRAWGSSQLLELYIWPAAHRQVAVPEAERALLVGTPVELVDSGESVCGGQDADLLDAADARGDAQDLEDVVGGQRGVALHAEDAQLGARAAVVRHEQLRVDGQRAEGEREADEVRRRLQQLLHRRRLLLPRLRVAAEVELAHGAQRRPPGQEEQVVGCQPAVLQAEEGERLLQPAQHRRHVAAQVTVTEVEAPQLREAKEGRAELGRHAGLGQRVDAARQPEGHQVGEETEAPQQAEPLGLVLQQ